MLNVITTPIKLRGGAVVPQCCLIGGPMIQNVIDALALEVKVAVDTVAWGARLHATAQK